MLPFLRYRDLFRFEIHFKYQAVQVLGLNFGFDAFHSTLDGMSSKPTKMLEKLLNSHTYQTSSPPPPPPPPWPPPSPPQKKVEIWPCTERRFRDSATLEHTGTRKKTKTQNNTPIRRKGGKQQPKSSWTGSSQWTKTENPGPYPMCNVWHWR